MLWLVVIIRLGELSGLLSVDIWYGLPIRKDNKEDKDKWLNGNS